MKVISVLEGREEGIERIDQEINELLILPYRYVEPVVLYKNQCGRMISTIGYKVNYRHFKHSLLPFHKPDRIKNIELYFILLTGECRQIPLRTVFTKKDRLEESLCFIPKE